MNTHAIRYVVGRGTPLSGFEYLKGSHGKGKKFTCDLAEATVYSARGVSSAVRMYKNQGFRKMEINCLLHHWA